jgi:hypothetical protein
MGLSRIDTLYVKAEVTFSTDAASTGSGMAIVPAYDISVDPQQATIARPVQRPSLGKGIADVLGPKAAPIAFKVDLCGLSTAASSGVTAVPHTWLSVLLKACGMSEGLITGDEISGTASTTTTVNVTDGTNFEVGQPIMVAGDITVITAINTNALTVSPPLSAAPVTAAVSVYAAGIYLLDDSDPGTVTFTVKSDDDEYTVTGCKGSVALEGFTAGGKPQLAFSFSGDTWTRTAKGSLPAQSTLTVPAAILAMDAPFYWGATAYATSEVGFTTGMTVSPKASTGGTAGRSGWVITADAPTITVKPYAASAWSTDYEAKTERRVLVSAGSTAGSAFAISFPNGQIITQPNRSDVGGLRGHDISIRANGPATEEIFYISFF